MVDYVTFKKINVLITLEESQILEKAGFDTEIVANSAIMKRGFELQDQINRLSCFDHFLAMFPLPCLSSRKIINLEHDLRILSSSIRWRVQFCTQEGIFERINSGRSMLGRKLKYLS